MDYVLRLLFFEMLGLGVIATAVKSFRLRDRWLKGGQALPAKLLRSPGESLQRETQDLNDWLMGLLAGIAATPAILLGQMPITISGSSITIMGLGITAWAVPLIYLLGLRRNLELALRGERAVAEELNRLMLDGCQVFHDYPAAPNCNIDHIVIASSGVYAIETKTRRKRAADANGNYEVIFDGRKLAFPRGWDTNVLDKARRNAGDLSADLTKAAKENVKVHPIVTVPGWSVKGKPDCDVKVLNLAEIHQAVVTNEKPRVSAAQIQSIARFVEQKCRNVLL